MTRIYSTDCHKGYFVFECSFYTDSTTVPDCVMRYVVQKGVPDLIVLNYRLLAYSFRRELASFLSRAYKVEQSAQPRLQVEDLNKFDSDLIF